MMKRIGAALLAAALILSLAGCASEAERQSRKTALLILRGDDLGYSLSTGTRAENQTLYDDGTIQVQLGGIEGTPDAPVLVLAVKNGRRKPIYFAPQTCLINGWQTDCWADANDLPGHSTTTVRIDASYRLELVQPSDISTVHMDFDLYDEDYISISSASFDLQLTDEEPTDNFSLDGVVLLDDGDYKVVTRLSPSTDGIGTALCTYFENKTNREVNFSTTKATLNDEAIEYMLYQSVVPNARCISVDSLYDRDSYDNISLTDDDVLNYKLVITDYNSDVLLVERDISLNISDLRN